MLLTHWKLFRDVDVPRLRECMRGSLILDGRHHFDSDVLKEHGFTHVGIGV